MHGTAALQPQLDVLTAIHVALLIRAERTHGPEVAWNVGVRAVPPWHGLARLEPACNRPAASEARRDASAAKGTRTSRASEQNGSVLSLAGIHGGHQFATIAAARHSRLPRER